MSEAEREGGPPLVLVLCPAYHGATLLALLLNNHPRVVALGDMLPTRAYDQLCACGQPVSACGFWREVAERTAAKRFVGCELLLPEVPRLIGGGRANELLCTLVALVARLVGPGAWRLFPRARRRYLEAHAAFERALRDLAGAELVVDGQKGLVRALVLATLLPRGRPLRLIHLVRDPRGYRRSCVRYRKSSAAADARDWRRRHRAIGVLARLLPRAETLRVRHEDLCSEPEAELERIQRFLDLDPESLVGPPRRPERHHLMGNRMLRTFDGRVRLDESWRELPAEERETTLRVAGALARAMGYARDG